MQLAELYGMGLVGIVCVIVIVPKASEFSEITISDTQSISIVLKDADGNIIANAPITYTVNGVENATTTDNDGRFVIQGENGALITINYAGNDAIAGTNMTLKMNTATAPEIAKVASWWSVSSCFHLRLFSTNS